MDSKEFYASSETSQSRGSLSSGSTSPASILKLRAADDLAMLEKKEKKATLKANKSFNSYDWVESFGNNRMF